jgi:hypothetical protein
VRDHPHSRNLKWIEDETVHMALAVVEHAMGAGGEAFEQAFRDHVRSTLANSHPAGAAEAEERRPYPAAGYAVAEAIRRLNNRVDVCRALFCHGSAPGTMVATARRGARTGTR